MILDQNGAESLLGQGDMLFSPGRHARGCSASRAPTSTSRRSRRSPTFWARQGEPELREDLLEEVEPEVVDKGAGDEDGFDPDEDPLLGDAIRLVVEMGTASTSMLQRRLRLGYTRAGRLIDMLERRGVISGYEGSKPRQVLVTEADLPRVLAALDAAAPSAPEIPPQPDGAGRACNGAGDRPARVAFPVPMPDIGATLREARMRQRIDISEVESETKIRAKYLRALENEEWDLLPGPTYVKSFLRTYAEALGLDGKLLIEEYKLRHERLSRRRAAADRARRGAAREPRRRRRAGSAARLGRCSSWSSWDRRRAVLPRQQRLEQRRRQRRGGARRRRRRPRRRRSATSTTRTTSLGRAAPAPRARPPPARPAAARADRARSTCA